MAYEHELEEWRSYVRTATTANLEAARDSCRAALGIIGDIIDDLGAGDTTTKPTDGPDEAA